MEKAFNIVVKLAEKVHKQKSFHHIAVSGQILLEDSYEAVLTYIHNIENLVQYEPKLWKVKLQKESNSKKELGFYQSTGVFGFVPFRDQFSYTINENGFHSQMETGLLKKHMNGGFTLTKKNKNQCIVLHYENYELCGWQKLFSPYLKRYLKRSMEKELNTLATCYYKAQSS